MTSVSSTLTNAPMTPNEVKRRYSNGRVLLTVFRNGYKNNGMCAVICVVKERKGVSNELGSREENKMPKLGGRGGRAKICILTLQKETACLWMRCYALKKS